jgi:ribonuclease HI
MIDETALNIYTDGSSYSKPRRGGVGILYIWVDSLGNEISEALPHPGYAGATNNQMELMASICALKNSGVYLEKGDFTKIVIYTDSQYIVTNYRNAMFGWPKMQWRNRLGKPIANAHLWKDLVRAIKNARKFVEFVKVKGHSKDKHNKAADKLAKESAKQPIMKPLSVVTVRRKLSSNATAPGSVPMLGQRTTIRVITSEYMPVQRTVKYRYEIMSKASEHYKKVDFFYSKEPLKPGHSYSVRFNKDNRNPGLLKVFKEVTRKKEA